MMKQSKPVPEIANSEETKKCGRENKACQPAIK